uniref:Coronin n=1 Tax=Meleagris gallopavo TaxID=9103 RepID=A0A803Y5U9_MELGA
MGRNASEPVQTPRVQGNDVLPLGTSLLGGDQKHRASPAALLQQQSSDSEILDVLKILLQKLQAQPGAQRAAFNLSASERGKPPHPTPCTALGGSRSARDPLSPVPAPGGRRCPTSPRTPAAQMSWRPQYRSSKFRNVYGKVASREHCFDGIPITKNVHDNHFCAVNARFLAIVTESAGGGSFLVIPLEQTGRIEPNYPKVCGHQGNVLDIKWNPFIENIIASCSEDTSVRIWEIPEGGLKRNMTEAVLELYGHSRRVGLVEWHPTTNNILFSAGYDYKVLIWNLDIGEPVKMIDCHTDVILCMSFNMDGSLLATSCKDKKLRVVEPRSGRVLQEASCKNHRVNRVVFLGSTKRLLTTGVSRWNTRQIALWDQEDLSMPLIEEEIDGLSGLLFPFYDADTHMLYLAGKGDGNIRYYEIGSEKPYLSYLMEFRSPAPQKGLGVMPKHGLDVSACEVFRFYKLVTLKGLIEPISMIVPRRSETYQEDIYPMTPGTEPALTPDEWLSGVNRDPILMSLKEGYKRTSKIVFKAPVREKRSVVVNGIDLLENVPPRTENEVGSAVLLAWPSGWSFGSFWGILGGKVCLQPSQLLRSGSPLPVPKQLCILCSLGHPALNLVGAPKRAVCCS